MTDKIQHGELVRDRIPEIIAAAAAGHPADVRVLGPEEMVPALPDTLREETEEPARAAPGELADVHEVLTALTAAFGFSPREVAEAAAGKRAERGGFTRGLWPAMPGGS
ncbi:hypothetical protein Afil01_34580 [Actinorhabdospora filicis]|uniref:Phosphoribosyl-ATP pyrophosphohydrolase n=1 Tax=Actinorhabdospora filicis TaxID=1785913 RepID=A0A9W6WAJ1_9ACTN|nr:nucleoside triphosphate pyrophosphohydrolase [Actinorhabdospora filicis]GLZ78651.1 hypothetical protein Afil01_34580 [Actinorhabdospora filicis]